MGYTIKIGNAVVDAPDEDDTHYRFMVEPCLDPKAPAAPHDCNGQANFRWPSYSTWKHFAVETGLDAVFYNDDVGLLRPHPGCAILTDGHAEKFELALKQYRRNHPEAVARFGGGEGEDCGPHDGHLARLEWLAWWTRWAVENCERPAMENT